MDVKLLHDIGLTDGETKVYLALISLGTTKTGPLASKAGVSSSKVYKILDRLIKKGLVGHATKGKVRHYSALEPKRVLNYIDEKEQELRKKREQLQKIIPELELEQKLSENKPEAVIYEGFKAIKMVYPKGDLGYRGDKINELIERMSKQSP